jgi:hypothetical protein
VWLVVDVDGQHDGGTDELNDDRFRHADAARYGARYMLLPSYSGYSSVSGPVILTKPGSPERIEQSTLS